MAVTCPSCAYENNDDARFCAGCGEPLGATCAVCGTLVPPGGRFCPNCGTPLEDPGPGEAPVEERRVVSILFADLAGFTSRSDQADPEDVRRTLMPFHAIAKEEIERYGGALDKFIGDAAMGVFGAPVAHEDDAERAIRAALAIQARTSEMEIPVRAAVNTGEAVVTFATGPQVGENVAGDVVNTASRLQSVAPHGGVAVGESTYRATRGAVDFRELDPVTVKGKSDPLRIWVVVAMREHDPGRADEEATPFVGRERERSLLRDLYARAVRERSLQLVTIVGEPGIGKTRLVGDLRDHVRSHEEPTTWYRGRCLPYGESVTFAPLEEVVREATGVRRSDHREEAAEKLGRHLRTLEPRAEDAEWLRARLAPLLGLVDVEGQAANREESFAAWTRFLGDEASLAPTVLVIEDLHWADPTMLDFLDQLGDRLSDVPLLLVATARPELFDIRRDWGAGKPNSSTLTLSPLTENDMQHLLAELLVRTVLPPGAQAPLVASAGGNPLYALEFVRMLADRGAVDDAGSIALPDSIQALIAARLDALSPTQRSLLQDAAVVGDHFWSGAVASMNAGDVDVAERLRELQRRGMIRRSSTQTIEDQDEFSFSHGLVRDVAYKQIPRAGRVRRHLAVARWLEETAGDRLEDRAEPLAYHTTAALSLARAAQLPEDTPELQDEARRFLVIAGKRQTSIDVAQAALYYERALELTPADHPDRSTILREATGFRWRSGRLSVDEAVTAYEEAVDLALMHDDAEGAAFALRRLYFQLGFRGDSEAARAALERGIELLDDREPSPVLAELYAALAEDEMFGGRSEESLRWATRALELPHSDSIAVMTLHIRGNGRLELGDLGGMDDLWEALRQAEASGTALDQATSYSYLSEWVGVIDGPVRGLEMNDASIEICDRRGIQGQGMWGRAESLWLLYDAGRWDDLLAAVATLLPWATEHGDTIVESIGLSYRARVLANRGHLDGLRESMERALPIARQVGDLQVQAPVFVAAAIVEHAGGDGAHAVEHVRDFEEATRGGPTEYRELQSPEIIRLCLAHGEVELATRVLGDRPVHVARTRHAVVTGKALLAEAGGDHETAAQLFADAAEAWASFGDPFERAHSLDGRARCLERLGRGDGCADARRVAADLFAGLGVAPLPAAP
jgi:class 3 adenylate cyclase/tetratricopeptide (TPR) repeat protein